MRITSMGDRLTLLPYPGLALFCPQLPESLSRNWRPAKVDGIPDVFTGGWVGYAGYDTVRYVYGNKLPFDSAPEGGRRTGDKGGPPS